MKFQNDTHSGPVEEGLLIVVRRDHNWYEALCLIASDPWKMFELVVTWVYLLTLINVHCTI